MIKRTVKEKKFIKAYIENGGNATKAYLACNPGVQRNSACELGSKLLRKIDISMNELMNEMGIDDNVLTNKLKEGLEATKLFGVMGTEIKDHASIVKYLDIALKLKAKYPVEEKKVELTGQGVSTIILKERVYNVPGNVPGKEKELKEPKLELIDDTQEPVTVDTPPF